MHQLRFFICLFVGAQLVSSLRKRIHRRHVAQTHRLITVAKFNERRLLKRLCFRCWQHATDRWRHDMQHEYSDAEPSDKAWPG